MSLNVVKNMLLCLVVVGLTPGLAKAQITTDYSFTQVNLDGNDVPILPPYEDAMGGPAGPAPIPNRTVTEFADGDSRYDFDLSAGTGAVSLNASAMLNVTIDHSAASELFDSIDATAQAKSSYAQLGTVQGAAGFPSGTIVLHWTVSGTTAMSMAPDGPILIQDISNRARLQSTIPGQGALIFEDLLFPPPGETDFGFSFPIDSGVLVFEVPWTAGETVPLFFDLCLDIITRFANDDASGVTSSQNLDLSMTAEFAVGEIRGFDEQLGEEVVIPGATLDLQDPSTCLCNQLTTSAFEPPMGKKKKLGSTLPVKFQLFFDGTEITSQEQLNSVLTENGCQADCPHIRIFDVTGAGIELPEDEIEDNVGDPDAGDCFRFSDGNWIFNLRLGSAFASGGEYMVDVVIGECVLTLENSLFEVK